MSSDAFCLLIQFYCFAKKRWKISSQQKLSLTKISQSKSSKSKHIKKRKETNNKQKCKKQVSRLKKKRTKDKKFSRGVITSDVTHRKALRELQKKLRVEIWEKGLKLEIDSNSCLFLLVKKKNETQTYGPQLSFRRIKKRKLDGCSLGRIFFFSFLSFYFFVAFLGT